MHTLQTAVVRLTETRTIISKNVDTAMRATLSKCDLTINDKYLVLFAPNMYVAKRLNRRTTYLSKLARNHFDLGLIIRSGKSEFNDIVIDD